MIFMTTVTEEKEIPINMLYINGENVLNEVGDTCPGASANCAPPIALLPGVQGYGDVSVVIVDTRNTSRTCPSCGMVDKKNRPATYEFLCVSCSLAAPADRIATKSVSARV
jgi:predicted RNA-binding Zn-ribbon protein involved in translation (DUF1610 family)